MDPNEGPSGAMDATSQPVPDTPATTPPPFIFDPLRKMGGLYLYGVALLLAVLGVAAIVHGVYVHSAAHAASQIPGVYVHALSALRKVYVHA